MHPNPRAAAIMAEGPIRCRVAAAFLADPSLPDLPSRRLAVALAIPRTTAQRLVAEHRGGGIRCKPGRCDEAEAIVANPEVVAFVVRSAERAAASFGADADAAASEALKGLLVSAQSWIDRGKPRELRRWLLARVRFDVRNSARARMGGQSAVRIGRADLGRLAIADRGLSPVDQAIFNEELAARLGLVAAEGGEG